MIKCVCRLFDYEWHVWELARTRIQAKLRHVQAVASCIAYMLMVDEGDH